MWAESERLLFRFTADIFIWRTAFGFPNYIVSSCWMATLSKSVAQHIHVLHFLVCSPSELQIISAFPTLGLKINKVFFVFFFYNFWALFTIWINANGFHLIPTVFGYSINCSHQIRPANIFHSRIECISFIRPGTPHLGGTQKASWSDTNRLLSVTKKTYSKWNNIRAIMITLILNL